MDQMLPKWVIVVLAIYVVLDSIVHPGKRQAPALRRVRGLSRDLKTRRNS